MFAPVVLAIVAVGALSTAPASFLAVSSERMALRADEHSGVLCRRTIPTSPVLPIGEELHVTRVDAGRVTADMIALKTVRNWSGEQAVYEPVRSCSCDSPNGAAERHQPVSFCVSAEWPRYTIISVGKVPNPILDFGISAKPTLDIFRDYALDKG